ncbi:phosphotransferase [Ectobacillus sp. JY-23]|uniref:phosphotransferase n=1 Tax=Ectobacillus sp. JY-23 TaxID=2933872 RepID=UPI001FF563AD|nr:phosphotransferase [Ectobacillus sp. JY-23]UOY91325.1 phosphotransferase [Ectobacillus sp. JY-23]
MAIWNPEYIVTQELAKRLIEEQFQELIPVKLSLLGEGFDNTVYLVNNMYVFRFPRRGIAIPLLQTEGEVLPFLAEQLPLAVPEPVYYGTETEQYPYPFLGYKLVKGHAIMQLSSKQRKKMVEPLALFLRTLHDVPVPDGVTFDERDRLHIEKRRPMLQDYIERIASLNLYDVTFLREYAINIPHCEHIARETLVHGDLHIRNMIVDTEGNLSGVIDWGDMHQGDRSVDLAAIYTLFEPEDRRVFFDIYGTVQYHERELARFRAIFTNAVLLLYGYDKSDEALVKLAQNSLYLALTNDV